MKTGLFSSAARPVRGAYSVGRGTAAAAAAIFLLVCPAGPAAASSPADYFDLSPEQLFNAEVISVSKTAEKLSDAPAAVYVLTQEDILRSGVTTVADALRMVPGVHVAQSNSNSWAISVRGFNASLANKLLVMIDGRTVYNPLFAGTYWEVQDLMLDNIDRIEVVRGPGGALWGANAVNGVINIMTKKARDTTGNLVTAGYGNYERGFTGARHGGQVGEDLFYRVYAKQFNRDSFKNAAGRDGIDEWSGGRGGFRMDWDADEDDSLTVQGDTYFSESGQYYNTASLAPPYGTVAREDVESTGANILAKWTRRLGGDSALSLQSYVDYAARNESLLDDRRLLFDLEGQYELAAQGRHKIIIGGQYRFTTDSLRGSSDVMFNPASRSDNLYSIFLQDKIALVPDRWYLTLGSKLEHNDYTGFEAQPNARLQWHIDNRRMAWTSVARAVRVPSRVEHDLDIMTAVPPGTALGALPVQLLLRANPDFSVEELVAYEAGYRHQLTPRLSLDVSVFYNDYDDLAAPGLRTSNVVNNGVDPVFLRFPVVAANSLKGEVAGIETAAQWNVRKDLKLYAGYSFLEMNLHQKENAGLNFEGAEDLWPHHMGHVRAYWDIGDRWTLDTAAYYVDRLSGADVPGYLRLDMQLGWNVTDQIHVSLVGQNLLDDAHREFGDAGGLNATQAVRSVYGKIMWRF